MTLDEPWADEDHFTAVGRLDWAIPSARTRVLNDDALIARLKHINDDPESRFVCEEIVRRLNQRGQKFVEALEQALLELATMTDKGNRLNWGIYRLIVHLGVGGRELADLILPSPRRVRRLAAYRYYFVRNEVTDVARLLLPQYFLDGERDGLFVRVLTIDYPLLDSVGIAKVLELAPGPFWRMRVLQSVIAAGRAEISDLSTDYPEEYLWAVERLHDEAHLVRVVEILSEHQDNPRVVRRGLFCLAALRKPEELQRTILMAERLRAGILDIF